ncbi:hypothetical protein [Bacillus sp. REN10]|uniref:hypothetical protein n=1 Tax=Bacillus sp. REN10 TaxID=2782541 RepID=UPI00193BB83C|nr:hypothetical protein [Bacillus sp. REN10]
MSAIKSLMRMDAKQMYRDPMFMLIFFAPCLLIVFTRFGVPFLNEVLERQFNWELTNFHPLIMSFTMILIPLMTGVITGFMMLDERDESIISYFAVTPLTKTGYFQYRLAIPVTLTILFSTYWFLFSSLDSPSITMMLFLIPMLALEAAIIALFQAAFAANKIEGLALSKGIGLIVFAPLIAYFLKQIWQITGSLIPTFWPAKLYLLGANHFPTFLLLWLIGMMYHGLLFRLLMKKFLNQVE